MSDHPYHEEVGGYTISRPASLRAPSERVQNEALRRHLDNDKTPLRSDGDPGWTSFVGKKLVPRGIFEGIPPDQIQRVSHPRQALKEAIASRDALSDEMRQRGAEMKGAEAVEADAREKSAQSAATDRAAWAEWADGDRTAPAPANSLQRRAELDALAQVASRKLSAARDAYKAAEARYLGLADDAGKKVDDALVAVAIEVADEIKQRRQRRIIENAEDQAALLGLASYFRAKGDGMTSSLIERPLVLTGADKNTMQKELEAIEKDASGFPAKLLRDPDAKLPPRGPPGAGQAKPRANGAAKPGAGQGAAPGPSRPAAGQG